MKKETPKNIGKIKRITIPDRDMQNWIKALRESDLTEEQMDRMLAHLNRTYAGAKGIEEVVEKELEKLKEYLRKEHGKKLTEEQEEYLRKSIESRLPQ